jgi:hypothetical protein
MLTYAKLGLPGAIGSVDGTDVRWNKCPKANKVLCTDKSEVSSLGQS